ncbi:MAG: 2-oxo-4-hydroxy-4-carboxy-5-ureidoimidazoline decarboxylase [Burkholderiales bacterium]|nr:2-oxo-4-hydroxy-4-carboxy-5-ureidoimidazoline decarboxylase [Burkholderiales bacterium]
MPTLEALNRMDRDAFVCALGGVYERSPWVAERVHARRPFASRSALAQAMQAEVRAAGREAQLALVRAHPELGVRASEAGALTENSASEQARLGLTALSPEEAARVAELNRRYRERHGFPCIVALARHASRETVLAEMARRIGNPTEAELVAALEQIGQIAAARLEKLVTEA